MEHSNSSKLSAVCRDDERRSMMLCWLRTRRCLKSFGPWPRVARSRVHSQCTAGRLNNSSRRVNALVALPLRVIDCAREASKSSSGRPAALACCRAVRRGFCSPPADLHLGLLRLTATRESNREITAVTRIDVETSLRSTAAPRRRRSEHYTTAGRRSEHNNRS